MVTVLLDGLFIFGIFSVFLSTIQCPMFSSTKMSIQHEI